MKIAEIFVNIPVYRSFSYLIEDEQAEDVLYKRVKIPFGKRVLNGFVFNVKEYEESKIKYKRIIEISDKQLFLTKENVNFLSALSDALLLPKGKVFLLSFPPFYRTEGKISLYEEEEKGGLFLRIGTFDFHILFQEIKKDIKGGKEPFLVFSDYSVQDYFLKEFSEKSDYKILNFSNSSRLEKTWREFLEGEGNILSGILYPFFLPRRKPTIFYLIDEGPQKFYLTYPFRIDLREVALFSYQRGRGGLKIFSFSPSLRIFDFVETSKGKVVYGGIKKKNVFLAQVKRNVFSKELKEKTEEKLLKGKILFFINRNARKKFLFCPKCKTLATCEKDGAVLHLDEEGKVFCPLCKHKYELPLKCHLCGTELIKIGGTGISTLEKSVKKAFPGIKLLKFSREEVKKSKKETELTRSFLKGEFSLLIGTEVILKPFLLKNLSLVFYFFPELDLKSENPEISEKIFYNLTVLSQMVDENGELIIKSKNLDFYVIEEFLRGSYKSFIKKEKEIREKLKYFPFYDMIVIRTFSRTKITALKKIRKFKEILEKEREKEEELFGPFYKKGERGGYLFYLIFRGKSDSSLKKKITDYIFPLTDSSTSFLINRFI